MFLTVTPAGASVRSPPSDTEPNLTLAPPAPAPYPCTRDTPVNLLLV